MQKKYNFLIIDGYPKESREEFESAGMTGAGILYSEMLLKYLPGASFDIMYASDEEVLLPEKVNLGEYDGLLWPGCNLTVYKKDNNRVKKMLDLCDRAYEIGIPQFGTCWGIQIAVYVAGGEIKLNPKGREIGIGRKITLTEAGKKHPMFKGKPPVYSHFMSHDDEVVVLPKGTINLAGSDYTKIQAVDVQYKKGRFWGIQYHPEYDLHQMARLMVAREKALTDLGFFDGNKDFNDYINRLEDLHKNPDKKPLRWQLGIYDDILSDSIRQCEFKNWLDEMILK